MSAPSPKKKGNREKKVDFDEFEWTKYISEERLLEAIPTVYGCDPRDEEQFKTLLEDWKVERVGPTVTSNLRMTCTLL